jgi:DNA-binding response OmpR family regulator
MRILVVEDDRGIAQFLNQGLSETGYAVDVAEDGLTGLDYALAADYDVLVVDIQLPQMRGHCHGQLAGLGFSSAAGGLVYPAVRADHTGV